MLYLLLSRTHTHVRIMIIIVHWRDCRCNWRSHLHHQSFFSLIITVRLVTAVVILATLVSQVLQSGTHRHNIIEALVLTTVHRLVDCVIKITTAIELDIGASYHHHLLLLLLLLFS